MRAPRVQPTTDYFVSGFLTRPVTLTINGVCRGFIFGFAGAALGRGSACHMLALHWVALFHLVGHSHLPDGK
jgi:hypothetical protein